MFFRTADNQEAQMDEPSREVLRWEWAEQLASLRNLRCALAMAGTQGCPRVLRFCDYMAERSAA